MECRVCGARCEYVGGLGKYVCKGCNRQYDVELSDNLSYKIHKAEVYRNEYEFEEAKKTCETLLSDGSLDENTRENIKWEMFLSDCKILYFMSKTDSNGIGKYEPTFYSPEEEIDKKYLEPGEFFHTPEFVDNARETEKRRRYVVSQKRYCNKYDIFISRRGANSDEKKWAEIFYSYLLSKGVSKNRIFYAPVSLADNIADWEPHIYYALRSAKVMVLFASSDENLNSPWVRNEWKRYSAYRDEEGIESEKKMIITLYGGTLKVDNLPVELSGKQALEYTGGKKDREGRDWKERLYLRVEGALGQFAYVNGGVKEQHVERIKGYIERGKFSKAKREYKEIIERDPRNSEAHWGLVKCERRAFDDYDIIKTKKPLDYNTDINVRNAIDYADEKQGEYYRKVLADSVSHRTEGYGRPVYNKYLKRTKGKRYFKRTCKIAVSAAAVVAIVVGTLGFINPVHYSVEDGEATLKAKTWAFNLTVTDLSVDTYKDNPVTSIADGALKNSKLQTVTLASSVNYIGAEAFSGSTELKTVSAANAYITIGDYAFKDCTSLTSVTFGSSQSTTAAASLSLTSSVYVADGQSAVGEGAFENCSSLKSITLLNCAYIGGNAFSGCTSLTEIVLDITDETQIESGAFNNLSGAVISVPTISESLLTTLSSQYGNITFNTYTRDAVEETIYYISKLNSLSVSAEADIERAEQAYNSLTSSQKSQVTNYSVLQNARSAYDTVVAIDDIGEVTLDSGAAISEAEKLYSVLTDYQKTMIANYSDLTDARAVYDAMTAIDGIGTVTISSENAIASAEEMYGALTESQKDAVSNYSQLTQARKTVNELLAAAVIKNIEDIGTVTLASSTKITAAERAYAALSDAQKALVTNYGTLTDSRAIYNAMQKINAIGAVTTDSGDSINDAQTLYESLTPSQKLLVGNYSELLEAAEVYEVVVAIAGIDVSVSLSSKSAINGATELYEALEANEQEKVTNYDYLVNAQAAYNTVYLISTIGTISENSGEKIEQAELSYLALTSAQQSRVGNYSTLTDDRAVYDTIIYISAIGTVTLDSNSAISAAESAYNALTSALKKQVTNYSTLTDSRSVYDAMKAIDDIGVVGEDSGSLVSAAAALYSALSDELKELVTNYSQLGEDLDVYEVIEAIGKINDSVTLSDLGYITTAETLYDCLSDELKQKITNYSYLTDARAAYDVVYLISLIGDVTLESGMAITEAETAYSQITSSSVKTRVSNASTLTNAAAAYKFICAADIIGDVTLQSGDYIKSAEDLYLALSSTNKDYNLVAEYYSVVNTDRAIYNLMVYINSNLSGEFFYLGSDGDYQKDRLDLSTMQTLLNGDNSYTAITVIGLKTYAEDFYSYLTALYPDITTIRYDITSGTAITAYEFKDVSVTQKVVGSTSAEYSVAFTAAECDSLDIVFENYSAVTTGSFLDLSNVAEANLAFEGYCAITSGSGCGVLGGNTINITTASGAEVYLTAGNSGSGTNGATAIVADVLRISGESNSSLTITGGDGGEASSGSNGADGGLGISVITLNISSSGSVIVNGGNGSAGGSASASYSVTSYKKPALSGSDGGDGGNGGDAVNCSSITINGIGNYTFTGGNGGSGKSGGNGSGSNDDGTATAGSGGAGGDGGEGGTAMHTNELYITSQSAVITLTAGSGGAGGKGGDGGYGKDDNRRDNGGAGGKGGAGGNSGYCAYVSDIASVSNDVSLLLIAGSGGNGGAGGTGGNAYNDGSVSATCGAGGAGGDGGDSIVVYGVNVNSESYIVSITYANAGNGGAGGSSGDGDGGSYWLFPSKPISSYSGKGGTGGDIYLYSSNDPVVYGKSGGSGSKAYAASGGSGGAGAKASNVE